MVPKQSKQVNSMVLSDKEQKTLLKTTLRNIKRKYSKIQSHPDLGEEAIELKCEIDAIERELSAMK